MPRHLRVRSAVAEQGSCDVTGNRVACELGTVAVGQVVSITIRARAVRAGAPTNTARVDSPDCETHPCDTDPAEIRIAKPRLALTKKVNRRVLRAGQTASYRIVVRNPSGVALRKVRTCDRLPAGLALVRANPRARFSKGQLCWTEKRLGARKATAYRVVVRAVRGTSGRKVNTARATSPDARPAQARQAVRVIGGDLSPTAVTG